jgi:hypothetical protein
MVWIFQFESICKRLHELSSFYPKFSYFSRFLADKQNNSKIRYYFLVFKSSLMVLFSEFYFIFDGTVIVLQRLVQGKLYRRTLNRNKNWSFTFPYIHLNFEEQVIRVPLIHSFIQSLMMLKDCLII